MCSIGESKAKDQIDPKSWHIVRIIIPRFTCCISWRTSEILSLLYLAAGMETMLRQLPKTTVCPTALCKSEVSFCSQL